MVRRLRCTISGYGYMGEIRRRVVASMPDWDLVGIYEADPERRRRITGAPVLEREEDLLAPGVDAVFVCLPNAYSPALCVRALDAGKHVFCEKPPGRCMEDIREIRRHERSGLKLMFGFNHRFHPGIVKARLIIESGRLGRVIHLRGLYGKSGGLRFRHSWRNDKTISGGGILLDQGIHMLDLFRHLAGEFTEVKCFTSNAFWGFEVEDNACVLLRGPGGVQAMCHSSATFWKHTFRLDVTLEGGYLVVEGLLSKSGSYGRETLTVARRQFEDEAEAVGNPAEEVTYFDRDRSWDKEVETFAACIREDRPVPSGSSLDALRAMELVAMAYADAARPPTTARIPDEEHCRL